MAPKETSKQRKVFFPYGADLLDEAVVYDPPYEEGQTAADLRHDIIEATMTSRSSTAQVMEVHEKLSLTDREAFWVMRQLEENFAHKPIVDSDDLRKEFDPESFGSVTNSLRDKFTAFSYAFEAVVANCAEHPDLERRLHHALNDAMLRLSQAVDAYAAQVKRPTHG